MSRDALVSFELSPHYLTAPLDLEIRIVASNGGLHAGRGVSVSAAFRVFNREEATFHRWTAPRNYTKGSALIHSRRSSQKENGKHNLLLRSTVGQSRTPLHTLSAERSQLRKRRSRPQ